MLNSQDLSDILTINNIRIGDISPSEYEKIEIYNIAESIKNMINEIYHTILFIIHD